MAEVKYPEESQHAKEMAKWNKPYVFQPFPRMVYKAIPHPVTAKPCAGLGADITDPISGRVLYSAQQFSIGCQHTVDSESEFSNAMNQGWRETPDRAIEFFEERERSIGRAAAERHASDRRMSEKAQAEAARADSETDQHLPEVPVKRRGPGRPRINAAA